MYGLFSTIITRNQTALYIMPLGPFPELPVLISIKEAAWRSACRTRNKAVPGSSPALTTARIFPSSSPRPRLQIAKWFASGKLGF